MNKLHLICVALLDSAKAGGLQQERAELLFNGLSANFSNVPAEVVAVFVDNIRRILDTNAP